MLYTSLLLRGKRLASIRSTEVTTLPLQSTSAPRVTVLGIGNLLLQDEGVGVHLVEELASRELNYAGLDIIDAGTSPEIFSMLDDSIDKLIIVDAVKGGNEPGTLYKLSMADLETKSVMKKWKDRSFAAGVNRAVIEQGAAMLGVELIGLVNDAIMGMREVATRIGD